jgi:hypothetical protein
MGSFSSLQACHVGERSKERETHVADCGESRYAKFQVLAGPTACISSSLWCPQLCVPSSWAPACWRRRAVGASERIHQSLQDLKWGLFAPTLSHVINKTRAVGSCVDGSDYPQVLFHAGPTICLGGTHVRDPHGFMRYSYGTHIRWDPHIFVLWDPQFYCEIHD